MEPRDVKTLGPIIMACTYELFPGERGSIHTDGNGKELEHSQPCIVVRKSSYEEYSKRCPKVIPEQLMQQNGYHYYYEVTTD